MNVYPQLTSCGPIPCLIFRHLFSGNIFLPPHSSPQGKGVISPDTRQSLLSHLHFHVYFLHRQKGPVPQQPSPAPTALVVLPHGPHSNQALLPSMEERGREAAVTSKRRNGAGRGSRGMWGREAGEAVVWLAARPRGRRPAHLGTSCSFGGWPRTCTKPERLPQPNNSRPVPKPGIPGERIRRGPSSPLFARHASPSPGLAPTAPGTGFSPLQTVHICWPNHREARLL